MACCQYLKKIDMKKIIIGLAFCASMFATVSCHDEVEDDFLNPEMTTTPSIPKFFSYMLDNSRVRAEYWNIRTFLLPQPALYTQSVSFMNSDRRFQQQISYLDDYWRDYYTPTAGGVVSHMREIEKAYTAMSDEEKAKYEVFLQAARVVYLDQTAQMVDLWGDIPFSEAGSINAVGEVIRPKFDTDEEIYEAVLSGLEAAADYFASASLDGLTQGSFQKQDILLQGSLDKWRRYANSLRLRALMRISFKDANRAQTEVMEMLNSPADFPLVDADAFNVLLHPLSNYQDNMRNAVVEVSAHAAPQFLLEEVLKPANDPRIRVLFDKNTTTEGVFNADYYAMPTDAASSVQEENLGKRNYAILDSTTFLTNNKFPGIVITSSEVNFLKAEAFERWGDTGAAQAAYEKGVADAVKFSFYLHNLAPGPKDEPLDDDELSDMLSTSVVEYTGTSDEKLQKIWIQKWVSFGFIQSVQGWSELRRTKYPELSFLPDNSTPEFLLPPSRLVYPPNEKTFNEVNYAKVAAQDTPSGKIFWDVK